MVPVRRYAGDRRTYIAFGGLVLAASGFYLLWLFGTSEPFGYCLRQSKNYQAYQALHKEALFTIQVLGRFNLNARCAVHVLNIYQGAVTALAGVVIAFFTATLWLSTHRLWKSGEKQIAVAQETAEAATQAAAAAIQSADAMAVANNISRDALIASGRPWISVTVSAASDLDLGIFTTGDPNDPGNLGIFRATTAFRNHGNSPALGLKCAVILVGSLADIIPVQDEIQEHMRRPVDNLSVIGHTLFPSESTKRSGLVQRWHFIEGNRFGFKTRNQNAVDGRYLIGCLDYTFASGSLGHTRFAYILAKTTPSQTIMPDVGYAIESTDTFIPKDEIIVHRLAIGNSAH